VVVTGVVAAAGELDVFEPPHAVAASTVATAAGSESIDLCRGIMDVSVRAGLQMSCGPSPFSLRARAVGLCERIDRKPRPAQQKPRPAQ
jgi:hypothetical protein